MDTPAEIENVVALFGLAHARATRVRREREGPAAA
jgi:hypothetical protein